MDFRKRRSPYLILDEAIILVAHKTIAVEIFHIGKEVQIKLIYNNK